MGVWDETTPAGTDAISAGDDRIREFKVALGEALSHESSTFPGATPGSTPIFIPGFSRDTTANRPTGDSLVTGRLFINTTLNVLERYNGSSWDEVSVNFPSGTKMVFYQASAPTGWTAVAVDDKFLRVVTAAGTGGTTGGTVAASTSLAHTHTVDGHTHTIGAHTHSTPSHQHTMNFSTNGLETISGGAPSVVSANSDGAALVTHVLDDAGASTIRVHTNQTQTDGSGTSGSGGDTATGSTGPATDSQLGAFAYADVVIGTKD